MAFSSTAADLAYDQNLAFGISCSKNFEAVRSPNLSSVDHATASPWLLSQRAPSATHIHVLTIFSGDLTMGGKTGRKLQWESSVRLYLLVLLALRQWQLSIQLHLVTTYSPRPPKKEIRWGFMNQCLFLSRSYSLPRRYPILRSRRTIVPAPGQGHCRDSLPFQHAWERGRPPPQSFQRNSGVRPGWLSFVSASP